MTKAEKFENRDWFTPAKEAHGYEGLLVTSPHDNAPISDCFLESFQSQGLPLDPDMFSTGNTPHGCGHVVRSVYKGVRTTSAAFIEGERESSKIDLRTNTHIDNIIFDDAQGAPNAVGVNAITVIGRDQTKTQFVARKEIILATGTYGTPVILLESGIEPKDELARLEIPQRVESPGVGKNLTDHLVILTIYEVSKPRITHEHFIWHGGAKDRSVEEWMSHKTGFIKQKEESTGGLDPMGLMEEQPHVEFWNTEFYSPKYLFSDFPSDNKHAFAMAVELFSPRSKGRVTLASKAPPADPVVDHNYLSDSVDLLVFTEACRMANEIAVKGKGTKDIVAGSSPVHLTHHAFTTREQWEGEIRSRAHTCYHPAGTAKMGESHDSVVDPRLRVYGMQNLRVVDASIFPKLPCGHPQMAVYGVVEKAADMIKADAK